MQIELVAYLQISMNVDSAQWISSLGLNILALTQPDIQQCIFDATANTVTLRYTDHFV